MIASRGNVHLTHAQARALHLAAQGLAFTPRAKATRADVLDAIRRMQLLQIDTIHVVARSPYLVLFSRLPTYRAERLDALLASQAIFETWAHEACFAPIEDYALHRKATELRNHWGIERGRRTFREHEASMRALLDRVRARGPVKVADLESAAVETRKRDSWWGWRDEKRWLEAWFVLGDLMVARRESFHRVYDLRERVYPASTGMALPSADEVRRAFIEKAVTALGVTQARWVNDYFRTTPRYKDADLDPLVEDGTLLRVDVDEWNAPGYVHRANATLAKKAARGALVPTHATLLSPFDPVVWDRARALGMFGFDYRLECYTPAPKRRFGYFVLPILVRGALVGRLDAKAHRADGVFEVKALYLEPGVRSDAIVDDLARAITSCATWHGLATIVIARTEPALLKKKLAARVTSRAAAGPGARSAGAPMRRG